MDEAQMPEDLLGAGPEDKEDLAALEAALVHAKAARLLVDDQDIELPAIAIRALRRATQLLLGAELVQIEPRNSLLTTQEAAEFLGISRPSLIKLLGDGDGLIPFGTPGPGQSHRRIRAVDLVRFRERQAAKAAQRGRAELLEGRRSVLGDDEKLKPSGGGGTASPVSFSTTVNGRRYIADAVEPRLLLVYYLRDNLGLTGTHVGCDTSQCGACTIHMDGKAVKSCTMFAVQADGRYLTTIEGMSKDGELHPIQQAFWEEHGLQCGYCTPGFIMAAAYLLEQNPDPTEDEIRRGLEGNLCRCTGYVNIIKSVQTAAKTMSAQAVTAGVLGRALFNR